MIEILIIRIMTLKEILLLAAAAGFFIIWGLELYSGIPLKASYFWVMFGVGCLLYFQYSKNERLKKSDKKQPSDLPNPKKESNKKKSK
jgi:Flp pilus assembly protein TadB